MTRISRPGRRRLGLVTGMVVVIGLVAGPAGRAPDGEPGTTRPQYDSAWAAPAR